MEKEMCAKTTMGFSLDETHYEVVVPVTPTVEWAKALETKPVLLHMVYAPCGKLDGGWQIVTVEGSTCTVCGYAELPQLEDCHKCGAVQSAITNEDGATCTVCGERDLNDAYNDWVSD